ncbi:staphylococcal-like nuclease CAN2 [Artemisia annua]|uniref:Staphylococcal-like nuclease CAN2 n=1 Tax=Artemisia annua TaxID=35608 RepID=A0A2U1LN41_ARTAN|nr:staphylococcal-like nuclease CAN2 [Artemisia annua]
MGNALRLLYRHYFSDDHDQPLGHHGVSSSTVGVSALAHHLFHFEITFQVPEGLSKHVTSTKNQQSKWYKSLLKEWRESKPPPKSPEEVSRLIIRIIKTPQGNDLEEIVSKMAKVRTRWGMRTVLDPN